MRLWSWNIAAAGVLCFAGVANAADNPYGAPAALPRPAAATRMSPYWTQYANHTDAEGVPAIDDTVVQGYGQNGSGANGSAPAVTYGQSAYAAGGNCASGNCGGGDSLGYGDAGSPYDAAINGCGEYDMGMGPAIMPFYASAAGLVMTRGPGNRVFTTYDANNINNQLLHTQDAATDWTGGFQLTAGYRFGCSLEWGVEATYWMLGTFTGSSSINGNGNLSTPFDTGFVNFPGPVVATTVFDNADRHTIDRRSNVLNLELNLLRFPICCSDKFQLTWLAGVRWFRFTDAMTFSSYRNVPVNGINDACLHVRTENNLVGFQIGARCAYAFTPCFKVYANPSVGLYGNIMDSYSNIYNSLGQNGVTNPPAPGVARNFPVYGNKTDVAILSSIDLGAEYQLTCNWKIFGGYRVVAASGVAMTDQQIPHFLNDTPEWENVKSNGNLILHGAYAGAEFRF
ncbi:MAG: Lpg1974 family pore-forming outer membrane protein [Pirellulales bacterium]